MKCPICAAEMREEKHRGVLLDLCPSCQGVWFDWGELEAFNEREGEAFSPGVPGPDARYEPTGDSVDVMRCPRCERDILRTGRFGKHKVLRCTSCSGFFLPLANGKGGSRARRSIIGDAIAAFQDIVAGIPS